MSFPTDHKREPITEMVNNACLQLADSVYFYNAFNKTISTYTIFDNGFSFTVVRLEEKDLIKQYNFIWLASNNKGYRSREIGQLEFDQFTDKLTELKKQTQLLKPLITFEDYVKTIRTIHGIEPNK